MEQAENAQGSATSNSLLKRILKILSLILGLFIIALGLAFAYLYTNQSTIKNAITQTLNEQLATEVSVGSIDIDFFSKFPEVAIKFASVRAKEVTEKPQQSLFLFDGIYVRFGIWDLIDGDYTVRKLSFDEGEVNLRILKNGSNNWHFWKSNADTADTREKKPIQLEQIEWNNARFRYLDESIGLRILVDVDGVSAKGNFAAKTFSAEILGQLKLADLTYKELDLADDVVVNADVLLQTSAQQTSLTFNSAQVGEVDLDGTGIITGTDQQWNLTSSATAIKEWIPLIPKAWRPDLSAFTIDGQTITKLSLTVNDAATELTANAALSNAKFGMDTYNLALQNGSANITYRLAATKKTTRSSLQIENAKMKSKSGAVAFSILIDDLVAPKVSANGQLDLQLEELMNITRPGLIAQAKGRVQGNFKYAEKFKSWDDLRTQSFTYHTFSGALEVSNGQLRFENSNLNLRDISAELQMRNKDLIIDRLFVREGESEFLIDGWMYNALYLGANRPIPKLSVRLQSEFIDLNRILDWQLPKRNKNGEGYSTDRAKPLAIAFNAKLDVTHFHLIRFDGYDLAAEIWNDGLKIKGKNISFKGLDGAVDGSFSWSTEPSGYRFWTKGKLQNIDIHKLFGGFENFGQAYLLADNIYGKGNAQLETSMAFDKNMKFIPASIKLAGDFSIENGRIVGYKPLLSLSSIVETKDLQDVRFDKLENQITIADQVISIPQMEIKSSALDLVLQGRHSFDQQIDYSIRLALSDVIKKKKPKASDLDEWIVEAETKDQPYIWVHVGCSVADPCLSLDREMLKNSVKDEWKQQGEDIKNIFKPEPANKPKEDPTKGELIFEWEEEEPDTNKR